MRGPSPVKRMDTRRARRAPHRVRRIITGIAVCWTPGFVHLHVHSSYSLLEGALTIGRLAELAKADRQPALALTDTDNMFGALEFSEKLAGAGIQPIVGCALGGRFRRPGAPAPRGHRREAAARRAARRPARRAIAT